MTTTWRPTTRRTASGTPTLKGFVRLWGLGVATWSARQGPGAQTGVEPRPAEAGEVRGEH
jgi:hypothetical protein